MEKQDLRVKKTKELLKNGLITMMKDHQIKDITVKELCQKVNVNRGTFYLHYLDIYDLKEKIENELLETLDSVLSDHLEKNAENHLDILITICEFIYNNKPIFIVLLGGSGDMNFSNKLKEFTRRGSMDTIIKGYIKKHDLNKDYFPNFIMSGSIGVIQKWIDDDFKEKPEVIALELYKMTNLGG